MAGKYLKDGEDFGDHPDHFPKDFGFSGSTKKAGGGPVSRSRDAKNPVSTMEHGDHSGDHESSPPTYDPDVVTDEHGGHDGGPPDSKSAFAHGGNAHPHGHHVVHVEQHPDGSVVMHHGHGGMSVMHADGHMSHHDHTGAIVHAAHGGAQHHQDASTYVGQLQRGLEGAKAHEAAEGEHLATGGTAGEYGMGGRAGMHPRLPRGMKPAAGRARSPIGGPPVARRNPTPNAGMGMGVEPSAEPDVAGTLPGAPAMRKGGRL